MTNIRRKLKGVILDLVFYLRKKSWKDAIHFSIKTLLSLPLCRMEYKVLARSLDDLPDIEEPRIPVIIREATTDDLDLFQDTLPPSRLRDFSRRITGGRHLFLALDGKRIAAYCWATRRVEFDMDNIEIRLQKTDAFGGDTFTFPEYRRQGIQTALQIHRMRHMKEQGCQRMIFIVETKNRASEMMLRQIDYKEIDHLSFRRILWKRTFRYKKGLY